MAFTDDMENIVKATGLTEDELASLIIAKEKEGWTNAEIADWFASNFDNKEYATKAQNELDAIYSLGFNPSTIDRRESFVAPNRYADEQRRASALDSIANSVNDWRDSHPEQWRVGMVNAMFGDNSLLSQYYASKNAADESEKNRQSQNEYNQYLKEYDRANAQKEKDAAYKKELKEAEVEMADLNRDLVKANASDAAVIAKRQEALIAKYPTLKNSNEEAQKAYDLERAYAVNLNRFKGQVKRDFLTDDEIQNEIERVQAESWIDPEDISKIVDDIRSIKPVNRMRQELNLQQDLNRGGEKRGKALDDKDLTNQANDAIKNNVTPSSLSDDVISKIGALGYTWNSANRQWKRKGAK